MKANPTLGHDYGFIIFFFSHILTFNNELFFLPPPSPYLPPTFFFWFHVALFEVFVTSLFIYIWNFCGLIYLYLFGFFYLFLLSLCVWSCGRGEHEQPKKEEIDEDEKQQEEQLEEVSVLHTSPCKPMMVVEVCCHQHELSIAVKACCLHQDFLVF